MECEDCKLEHCYRLTDIPFDKDPCSTCKVQETGETYGFKDICKKCNKDNCYFDPRAEEKIELKPCPFCGSEPKTRSHISKVFSEDRYHIIKCSSCGAMVSEDNKQDAIESWNRRADNGQNQ